MLQDYSRRRRLLQQSLVLVVYTIEASTSITDAVIAALTDVTPAKFDAELKDAAENNVFDTVETVDFTPPIRLPTKQQKSGGSKRRSGMTTTFVAIFIIVAAVFTGGLAYIIKSYCRVATSIREVQMFRLRCLRNSTSAQTRHDYSTESTSGDKFSTKQANGITGSCALAPCDMRPV